MTYLSGFILQASPISEIGLLGRRDREERRERQRAMNLRKGSMRDGR